MSAPQPGTGTGLKLSRVVERPRAFCSSAAQLPFSPQAGQGAGDERGGRPPPADEGRGARGRRGGGRGGRAGHPLPGVSAPLLRCPRGRAAFLGVHSPGDGLGSALGCAGGWGVPSGSVQGRSVALPCPAPNLCWPRVPAALFAGTETQSPGKGRRKVEEPGAASAVGVEAPCASPPTALLLATAKAETSSACPQPLQPQLRCCCSDFHLPRCLSSLVAPAQPQLPWFNSAKCPSQPAHSLGFTVGPSPAVGRLPPSGFPDSMGTVWVLRPPSSCCSPQHTPLPPSPSSAEEGPW